MHREEIMTYIIFHLSFNKFLRLIGRWVLEVPDQQWCCGLPCCRPATAPPDKCYLDSFTEGQCTGELPGNQRSFKMQNMSLQTIGAASLPRCWQQSAEPLPQHTEGPRLQDGPGVHVGSTVLQLGRNTHRQKLDRVQTLVLVLLFKAVRSLTTNCIS